MPFLTFLWLLHLCWLQFTTASSLYQNGAMRDYRNRYSKDSVSQICLFANFYSDTVRWQDSIAIARMSTSITILTSIHCPDLGYLSLSSLPNLRTYTRSKLYVTRMFSAACLQSSHKRPRGSLWRTISAPECSVSWAVYPQRLQRYRSIVSTTPSMFDQGRFSVDCLRAGFGLRLYSLRWNEKGCSGYHGTIVII